MKTMAPAAARFVDYLREVSRVPPPYTTLYLSLGECLAIIDPVLHIALMDLEGNPTPVSYGAGVPEVGVFYPVYETREGDRWIKILSLAWKKTWTDSPASIIPSDGYPYGPTLGLPDPMIAYAGRDYGTDYLSVLPLDSNNAVFRYGLAAPPDSLIAPATNPRIDKLVVDLTSGDVSWVHGLEAVQPQAPVTPVGKYEMGRVRLTPATTEIRAEVDASAAHAGYVMTDTRKDSLDNTLFLPISFNQAGAKFTGIMRKPSTGNRLELRPISLFGDGRDGAGIAAVGTDYNLATQSVCGRASGDCAFTTMTNWGMTPDGRPMLVPVPAGVVAGDQVCGFIARAKEGGDIGNVGRTHIGVVEEVSGGAAILESDPNFSTIGGTGDYYAFVIRVPQYNTLELRTGSRVWVTPWEDGGPGMIPIKTLQFSAIGLIRMDGAGCLGGSLNFGGTSTTAYDTATCRRWEGQGLQDKPAADIGDGIGMFGGGDGQIGDTDFSACAVALGQGGAGGGWGYGGWSGSGTGLGSDGYGENGVNKVPNPDVTTGAIGQRGSFSGSAPGLTPGLYAQSGYMYLGGGGGVGHVAPSHINTGAPGGNGGGCAAIFFREGSPQVNCDGAVTHLSTAALGMGCGGGGGGTIFMCSDTASDPRGNARGLPNGGVPWDDAFHTDGRGGNGGAGANILVRNTLLTGLFQPAATEIDLPDTPTTGGWLSEPVDLNRPRRPEFIRANWTLDGSDNIPPQFYLLGANDAQFTLGTVRYPDPTDYWEAGDALFPISSGVELNITPVVTERRRYWCKGVEMDTGTINPYDTPLVTSMELRGVR